MDDLQFGTRDKRGHWRPEAALEVGPLLDTPWSLHRIVTWLPGHFFPWNALFFGVAAVFWTWLTPEREVLSVLAPGWILLLLLRNAFLILIVFGALELRLFVKPVTINGSLTQDLCHMTLT